MKLISAGAAVNFEEDVSEVKATMSILKTEFKGYIELIRHRSEFLERRISHLENHTPSKK